MNKKIIIRNENEADYALVEEITRKSFCDKGEDGPLLSQNANH